METNAVVHGSRGRMQSCCLEGTLVAVAGALLTLEVSPGAGEAGLQARVGGFARWTSCQAVVRVSGGPGESVPVWAAPLAGGGRVARLVVAALAGPAAGQAVLGVAAGQTLG